MIGHFLSRHNYWLKDGRTWAMHWGRRYVRSQTDYILVTYISLFQNVAFWDSRNNTDHYLILGCLHGATPAAHLRYLGRRTRFSIRPPETPYKADHMFSGIWRDIPGPPLREHPRQAWI